ncbi:hypothetical protein RBH29_03760 [Herbivorax sp. ANBcel31]|uniref:hypothetical protein n=1 Tax=Herbivorax sp. ANBcel31 TaxID=3069754 RepID=UPI0027B5EFB1|nr:hypothetical protein [Herbivorax sp. ANBcel31]MDQ2085548.1 hypothetical protein [Herbivorax sp. ANBcel31]
MSWTSTSSEFEERIKSKAGISYFHVGEIVFDRRFKEFGNYVIIFLLHKLKKGGKFFGTSKEK